MQHVFIVGSKGIPGAYGGYETFVDKLTEYHQNNKYIKYHVACKSDESGEKEYHNAHCMLIKVPNLGAAQAIYYDVAALKKCCSYIREKKIENPIVYILACRIGPFAFVFRRFIHALGGKMYVNPDGHEWKREKWSLPIRKYWKISEKMMVKCADLLVCDSENIEKYIQREYKKYKPMTTYIAYGAEVNRSELLDDSEKLKEWYKEKQLTPKDYYLVVGRFVPENNYEIMINEFMKSKTNRKLAIVTNVENNNFYKRLSANTDFKKDARIQFVGTVYDNELLKKIRENAFAYIHGHEVGGTNPSLLEALGSTDLNLLLDVGFNEEVASDGALYWSKKGGSLSNLIEKVEAMSQQNIMNLGVIAKKRIKEAYSWEYIAGQYEKIFVSDKKK